MNIFKLCFTTPMKPIAAIVVPYFNELQRFNEAYFDLIQSNKLFQIYFVNDGSTDGTEKLIKSHYQSCSNVKIIGYDKNLGKAQAVKYGFSQVIQDNKNADLIIGFIDFDSSIDPSELKLMIENFEDLTRKGFVNSMWAVRKKNSKNNIERNYIRHLIGRMIHFILKLRVKNIPFDTQCGLKLFDRKSAEIFSKIKFQTRWLFEIEFLKHIKNNGIDLIIMEYELNYWREINGSKVTSFISIKNILIDLHLIYSR